MAIVIDKFGGMIPRISPDKLPDGAAVLARDCDLTSGSLVLRRAITAKRFTVGEIPASEQVTIAAPGKPARVSPTRLCRNIGNWLTVTAFAYSTRINLASPTGMLVLNVVPVELENLTIVEYTDRGLIVKASFPSGQLNIGVTANTAYNIYGPIFHFDFSADVSGNGGPGAAIELPTPIAVMEDTEGVYYPYTLPPIPTGAVPLFYNDRVYGMFQVTDVNGPAWTTSVEYAASGSHPLGKADVTFHIDLNYSDPIQRFYRFIATRVDDDGREGVPSEQSDLIVADPGSDLKLSIGSTAGADKLRIYSNVPGQDDFFLLDEVDSPASTHTWEWAGQAPRGVPLPPSGNIPNAAMWDRAVIHPAQFAVSYELDTDDNALGNNVMLSDVYRWFSWPSEYSIPIQEPIVTVAIAGGTIVVFGEKSIWGIGGSNPEYMSKAIITDSAPVKVASGNPLLCRLGRTIYYVSDDGLFACDGSSVQNMTATHFTQREWKTLADAFTTIFTDDGSIYLQGTTSIRVDLEEQISAITQWTGTPVVDALAEPDEYVWQGRLSRFDRKTVIDFVRIEGGGTVAEVVISNGASSIALANVEPGIITPVVDSLGAGLGYSTQWTVTITGLNTVSSAALYERNVINAEGAVQLTPENVELWENIWIKFPDQDRFVLGSLSARGESSFEIDFYANGSGEPVTVTATGGRVFRLPPTTAKASLWRVVVRAVDDGNPLEPIRVDGLILVPMRAVGADGPIREAWAGGGFPPWLGKRYEFPDQVEIVSAVVKASAYSPSIAMRIRYGANTQVNTINVGVSNALEFLVNGLDGIRAHWVEISFVEYGTNTPLDEAIEEFILFPRQVLPIQDAGVILRQGSQNLAWRGIALEFPDTGGFSVARVSADLHDGSYPRLRLYRDGATLPAVDTVLGQADVRLTDLTGSEPGNRRRWYMDLQHDGRVRELHLIGKFRHKIVDGVVTIRRDREPFSWLSHEIESPVVMVPSCGRVLASGYPVTVRLFRDGVLVAERVTVDSGAFRMPRINPGRTWELSVSASKDIIIHEAAVATSMLRLQGSGG